MGRRVEPRTGKRLAARLRTLRERRLRQQERSTAHSGRRSSLTREQRTTILEKTGNRCHICGGRIDDDWHADHVLARSSGGSHSVENYLPAHNLCNNYRWDYLAEEFQYVLKLGVWAAGQIRKETRLGQELAERFVTKEVALRRRRRRS